MTALTGQEKLIPHGLDIVTSDILIQDLVIARPFAQIAARVCFQDESTVHLYKDILFVNVNKKFSSEDLSGVMSKYSLPCVKFSLTINPWCHIQTAWKHKFKCAMEDISGIDQEENVEALQAGHTRATENQIYGLSTHSLAGAAEDILPLFLQASTAWQEHCQVVPGGKGLPYQQTQSFFFAPSHPPPSQLPHPNNSVARHSTHDLTQDHASLSTKDCEELVDNIATQVVERLMPMLTNLLDGFTKNAGHPNAPTAPSVESE